MKAMFFDFQPSIIGKCRAALLRALIIAPLAAFTPAQADIHIGQTTSLTGPVADSVGELMTGVHLYIDHINEKGGVHGEKIRLITLDDEFEPEKSAANVRRLLADNRIAALFMNRGTPHTQAILPLVQQHRVPLIAPSTGAMVLHQPVNPYVFNVRPSYQDESQKAVEYLHRMMLAPVAVVHVDDSFGADALTGALRGFRQAQAAPAATLKADRMRPDYKTIVAQLLAAKPRSVLWIGSSVAVTDGVKALRQAGGLMPVATLSNNASRGFVKRLGPLAHGIIVSQVFPDENAGSYALSREAAALAREKGLTLSPQGMEGFAGAKVLVEALRRAGLRPSREQIIQALNGLSRYDIGGLDIHYSPGSHSGLQFVEMSVIDKEGRFRR